MGIATSGPRRQPSPQLLTGSIAPTPARVRVSGAHAAVAEVLEELAVHRAMNMFIAAVALFVALPLLLLIAIAIRLTSRGPVFYSQERVGLDRRTSSLKPETTRRTRDLGGQPFSIYKFRTMRVDAEAHSGAVWATQNDPRVTPVGRFLRQYRLDEIPQLLNVMRGEMNIVGPRPERPTIFAELREHIKEYPLRQRAKPGITGLGPDLPPLRSLDGRRAHQGALRPRVHPAAQPLGRSSYHAAHRSGGIPSPRRLVSALYPGVEPAPLPLVTPLRSSRHDPRVGARIRVSKLAPHLHLRQGGRAERSGTRIAGKPPN